MIVIANPNIISWRKVINMPKNNKLYKKIIIDKSNSKKLLSVNLENFKSKFTGNIFIEYHLKPSLAWQ